MLIQPVSFFKEPAAAVTHMRPQTLRVYDDWMYTSGSIVASLKYDDSDYVYTDAFGGGAASSFRVRLAGITDPGVDAGFTLNVGTYATDAADYLRMWLFQDGVQISASYYEPTMTLNTKVDNAISIPTADIAAITDWTRVELAATIWVPDAVRIYYMNIELP